MKSTSIFITTSVHADWLYKQMMPELRVAKQATFFILCAAKRYEEFNSICQSEDNVVTLEQVYSGIPSKNSAPTVYEVSRKYEAKYKIKYMKDIIQLCPISSASFMGYVDNDIYSGKQLDIINIYNEINGLFDYFEKIFTENNFYAAIVRPKGLMDTVATYVAIKFGVPSTFFHSSYFGSDAVWANGPFMGAKFFEHIYEQTSRPRVIGRLQSPNNVWRKPALPSFFKLLKALFLMLWNYLVFFISDLKNSKKSERTPLVSNLRGLVHNYSVQKYLHRESSNSLESISESPYFYFALPFEPEYTVQSLCKEFADVNAILRQTALSLPAGYKLVLKEHQRIGNRSVEFYERWRRFPNVIIANPTLHGVSLIEKSEGTITFGGSTPIEAAQFGIPSIIFGANNPYHFLPSIFYCDSIEKLERLIDRCLSEKTKLRKSEFMLAANKFKSSYETVTFDADDTVLNRSGHKFSIPKKGLEKAVKSFIKLIDYHYYLKKSHKRN